MRPPHIVGVAASGIGGARFGQNGFLLTEVWGDFLLLQTGDKIIIDFATVQPAPVTGRQLKQDGHFIHLQDGDKLIMDYRS